MKSEILQVKCFKEIFNEKDQSYPIGAIVYYGPDNETATKVAVGIVDNRYEVIDLKTWCVRSKDIRVDGKINGEIFDFLKQHNTKRVAASGKIVGCPHEEGNDFPVGSNCPHCTYWSRVNG